MSNGGFQNFFHLITGLPGGFGPGGGGTIPAALLASLAGAGALTAGVTAAAALAAVIAGEGDLEGGFMFEPLQPGVIFRPEARAGLAFISGGRVESRRARRATVTRAAGPRRPTRG